MQLNTARLAGSLWKRSAEPVKGRRKREKQSRLPGAPPHSTWLWRMGWVFMTTSAVPAVSQSVEREGILTPHHPPPRLRDDIKDGHCAHYGIGRGGNQTRRFKTWNRRMVGETQRKYAPASGARSLGCWRVLPCIYHFSCRSFGANRLCRRVTNPVFLDVSVDNTSFICEGLKKCFVLFFLRNDVTWPLPCENMSLCST